ncbi:MAG: hypothetical protein J3Q66DRAFT_351438 [Benniella sp.]|nr:MAG: hypothetical protein J3Q66DRAFT_351438 [Benniella sp.]
MLICSDMHLFFFIPLARCLSQHQEGHHLSERLPWTISHELFASGDKAMDMQEAIFRKGSFVPGHQDYVRLDPLLHQSDFTAFK